MKLTAISVLLCMHFAGSTQNVGIGTTNPNQKAVLEIKATDKGVLFPRLTTAQRDAITNPPNGLHVFNTDEQCLNYFDSLSSIWNCYCQDCQTVTITIAANTCNLDFYETYAKTRPARKYLIKVLPGVVISGCASGDTALNFTRMPSNAEMIIVNHGTIAGAGGKGGSGALEQGCSGLWAPAQSGTPGGSAIATRNGVIVRITNSGIVAGGGGGGGGSNKGASAGSYGGGGGGGAGIVGGLGGLGGGHYSTTFNICGPKYSLAQGGYNGTEPTGGAGGSGLNGGNTGGNGGNRGMPGQNGSTAAGGAAGKAIAGGAGNILQNVSGGQSFGSVD